MPNWAEGVIKLRGKREDIKTFLKNGFVVEDKGEILAILLGKEGHQKKVIEISEDEDEFVLKGEGDLLIKGASRAAIEGNITWYFKEGSEEDEVLHIDNFKQAWGVSAVQFANISKQYNIDIKIFAFESGMEFNQEIEIVKGEIIKDIELKFDNYEWDCPFPNIGG